MKKYVLFLFTAFCLIGVADRVQAQSVSGSIGNGTAARGGQTRGRIVLDIPGRLHVNSNRPASEYAIPTVVRLTSAGGARVSGAVYPRGRNRKFQFSENLINVYEGRVAFPFTLHVPANFRGETVRVRAIVRYQACTEEVCYPPKNGEITLTARVR
ncbi:MAG: protein-disulfide reductase DsbD N-terminal domain-containing protein [Acidobacteria bacterium]|nr:protein-disulfide reductase DsbD N-terminal domain-containing protein [Acidobacteriota bacterium]MCA1608495.1 protein-disulfide reductase DsbD N-terminal domain-containing protein [Acidobacteriota bacterium]